MPGVRPSRHPFHELDNVVMTPHCSGWTEGLMERRFAVIADNVERLQGGRPLINQVHPAAAATAPGPPTHKAHGRDRAHASRTGLRASRRAEALSASRTKVPPVKMAGRTPPHGVDRQCLP